MFFYSLFIKRDFFFRRSITFNNFYKDKYNSPYDIDPAPDGDSPYSDAEYIITPKERNKKALESKRESHGRDHNIPFNW